MCFKLYYDRVVLRTVEGACVLKIVFQFRTKLNFVNQLVKFVKSPEFFTFILDVFPPTNKDLDLKWLIFLSQ